MLWIANIISAAIILPTFYVLVVCVSYCTSSLWLLVRVLLMWVFGIAMLITSGFVFDAVRYGLLPAMAGLFVIPVSIGGVILIAAWRNPQCALTLQKIFQPKNSQ